MKIGVAQTRSIKGDISGNIQHHKEIISLAASNGADIIVFPELSLTGYEPTLASNLATTATDSRLAVFQDLSNSRKLTIGVGLPIKDDSGIHISMLLFQPNKPRKTYSKRYLHPDEESYFVEGQTLNQIKLGYTDIALALCYELSVPEHVEGAFKSGAEIYLVSAAKSAEGVSKAATILAETASKYSMTVLLANCIGRSDGFECGGKTAVWNNAGVLLGQLDETSEGILIFDTVTCQVAERVLAKHFKS